MIIGYARTSTLEQEAGLQAQIRDLQAAGVEKIYQEQTSAMVQRPQLIEAVAFARAGDVLVVTKLDRLARSVPELCRITAELEQKQVGLRILGMGVDTSTPAGKLMLNIFGSIAQFEREIMLERQREGIDKAKKDGKYKGRKPTARAQTPAVLKLWNEGFKKSQISEKLGISWASVHDIVTEIEAL